MKIIFKDYQGNQIYSAELTVNNDDMLIIEPIPTFQPRNPLEAVNQLMEKANNLYPRMKLYTVSNSDSNNNIESQS